MQIDMPFINLGTNPAAGDQKNYIKKKDYQVECREGVNYYKPVNTGFLFCENRYQVSASEMF